MSDQYEISFRLSLLKKYVKFAFKSFYSDCIVVGRENIPTDCPVIFAPNHLNALMDALAVHTITPDKMPVTFLARADIFNNKIIAKFLRFIKIMPAFRMRDGVENLGKNNEIFELCVDILHHNKTIGIMPEGNQGEQRKLRVFTKGIFRIAFSAQQKFGSTPNVKIVPIGIDFGDIVKFGKHIIVNIGKPIEVSDFMDDYAENPVIATNKIRDCLRENLSSLTINLDTNTYYDCFETTMNVASGHQITELNLPKDAYLLFEIKQEIARKLVLLEKNEPEKIIELDKLCGDLKNNLRKLNLKNWVLDSSDYSMSSIIIEGLFLLITFPFFLIGLLVNIFPFFIPVYIRKSLKVEYEGFFSSIQFVIGIITFPIFYLLQTILVLSFTYASWTELIIFFVGQYFLGKWAIEWYRTAKRNLAKQRFRTLLKNKSSVLENTINLRNKIIQLINK